MIIEAEDGEVHCSYDYDIKSYCPGRSATMQEVATMLSAKSGRWRILPGASLWDAPGGM